jgi:hypothetical protein
MISLPFAVNNNFFKWQAELWWWNHQQTYGDDSTNKGLLVVIDKNFSSECPQENEWYQHIPHVEVSGVWSDPVIGLSQENLAVPLNIQVGLRQVLHKFSDEQILEICDCDMFHFKKHYVVDIPDDVLYVSDIYENWHLKSLTNNKNIIQKYFKNQGGYYNGGFVPIIGRVKTFKKIINDWELIHRDILKHNFAENLKWWAGMYALQAACENSRVNMIAKDWCYVPEANEISEEHYIGHYSVDKKFNKSMFPNIDVTQFRDNVYYKRIKEWFGNHYLVSCPNHD